MFKDFMKKIQEKKDARRAEKAKGLEEIRDFMRTSDEATAYKVDCITKLKEMNGHS